MVFSSHVMEVVERLCTPRGDPGRRHRSSGSGTLDEVRGDRSLEEVFVEVVGGRTATGEELSWLSRERGRRRCARTAGLRSALRPAQAAADGQRLPRPGLADRHVHRRRVARALVRRQRLLPLRRAGPDRQRPVRRCWSRRLGGGLLVLGWLLLPLVFFGVDETLDPARFALLPLPRRTLVDRPVRRGPGRRAGGGDAARDVRAGDDRRGRWAAGRRGAGRRSSACVAGLLLCVAVEPGGDQRVRHHAAVPPGARPGRRAAGGDSPRCSARCRSFGLAALREADWARLTGVATVIGWTPLGAP